MSRFPAFSPLAPALAALALAGPAARAAPADPAAARVEAFDQSLLETMKRGEALGAQGRYRKLAPAVEAAFDLPTMTRFAVGPAWATMPAADRQALVKAFTRLSVASYAHNFDRFGGERFLVAPTSVNVAPTGGPAPPPPPPPAAGGLTYRLRQAGGGGEGN